MSHAGKKQRIALVSAVGAAIILAVMGSCSVLTNLSGDPNAQSGEHQNQERFRVPETSTPRPTDEDDPDPSDTSSESTEDDTGGTGDTGDDDGLSYEAAGPQQGNDPEPSSSETYVPDPTAPQAPEGKDENEGEGAARNVSAPNESVNDVTGDNRPNPGDNSGGDNTTPIDDGTGDNNGGDNGDDGGGDDSPIDDGNSPIPTEGPVNPIPTDTPNPTPTEPENPYPVVDPIRTVEQINEERSHALDRETRVPFDTAPPENIDDYDKGETVTLPTVRVIDGDAIDELLDSAVIKQRLMQGIADGNRVVVEVIVNETPDGSDVTVNLTAYTAKPPVAHSDTAEANPGSFERFDVVSNDSIPAGFKRLNIVGVEGPGVATPVGEQVLVMVDLLAKPGDTITVTYEIEDKQGRKATSTLTLTIPGEATPTPTEPTPTEPTEESTAAPTEPGESPTPSDAPTPTEEPTAPTTP